MTVEIVVDTLQAVSSYIIPAISLSFVGQIWFFYKMQGVRKVFIAEIAVIKKILLIPLIL